MGMIKDYVIVTIVYLNALYREKGQMIGYKLMIQYKQLLLKLCSDYISSLRGIIAFHKASTASNSTSWSGGPTMAMFISLNIDAGSSRLRSRSLICFISLKECSTVAVDTGSAMAMMSRILMLGEVTHFASLLRNNVASSFNDKHFSSKMTNLKVFHSCLVSVLSTSAGV